MDVYLNFLKGEKNANLVMMEFVDNKIDLTANVNNFPSKNENTGSVINRLRIYKMAQFLTVPVTKVPRLYLYFLWYYLAIIMPAFLMTQSPITIT